MFAHLAFINTPRKEGGLGKVNIPLLSDLTKQTSLDYGVLVPDGEDAGVTFRALFIISPKGVLRQITINDLPVGRSVDETLRLIKAFQFTDEHGEVCPANWQPVRILLDSLNYTYFITRALLLSNQILQIRLNISRRPINRLIDA